MFSSVLFDIAERVVHRVSVFLIAVDPVVGYNVLSGVEKLLSTVASRETGMTEIRLCTFSSFKTDARPFDLNMTITNVTAAFDSDDND